MIFSPFLSHFHQINADMEGLLFHSRLQAMGNPSSWFDIYVGNPAHDED